MKLEDQSSVTSEQHACKQHFIKHTTQQNGKFVVRLPRKMDPKQLGSPLLSANRRLDAVESKLERYPELEIQYHNLMKDYEQLSHGTCEIPR